MKQSCVNILMMKCMVQFCIIRIMVYMVKMCKGIYWLNYNGANSRWSNKNDLIIQEVIIDAK